MTPLSSGHLTDDQFTQCVTLAPAPESEAHLRECSQCRDELSRFTSAISSFDVATFAWSEAQPQVSLRGAATSRHPHPLLVHARWVFASAVILIVGIPVVLHGDHQAVVPQNATAVAVARDVVPDDTDAQIAQDNKLMRSVNLALGATDPSPFREYQIQETARPKLKRVTGLRSE